MVERQEHGFLYQKNVRNRQGFTYTAKWDVKAVPCNQQIKCIGMGNSIMLGDVIGQFDIKKGFEIVIGFYKTVNGKKRIVREFQISVTKRQWKSICGNMDRQKLEVFDSFVKSKGRLPAADLKNFRAEVQKKKKELLKDYTGLMSIYPKIDSNTQRRVQCGISFKRFVEFFNLDMNPVRYSNLFNKKTDLWKIKLE